MNTICQKGNKHVLIHCAFENGSLHSESICVYWRRCFVHQIVLSRVQLHTIGLLE